MRQIIKQLLLMVMVLSLAACGFQAIPKSKNKVEAAWAEVQNQYKRRADLIPNLVEVVKGYAKHEKETLEGVIEARAKATQVTVNPNDLNEKTMKQFQGAQGELSRALGRLMVVSERYPDLKANQNFRDLQVQLEGTENRITVARQRYIEAINEFNNHITVPPNAWTNSIFYHNQKMPQFTVEGEPNIDKAPTVTFQ